MSVATQLRRGQASRSNAPDSIPGLVGWWRADDIALADDAAVTTWPDRAGSNDLTGVNGPTYKTTAFNGQPCVRFSAASSQYLTKSSPSGLPTTGEHTVLVVLRFDAGISTARVLVDYTATNKGWLGFLKAETSGPLVVSANGVKLADLGRYLAPNTYGTYLWTMSSDNAVSGWANNVGPEPTVTGIIPNAGADTFRIGATGTGYHYTGDIAEVAIWNSALSAASRWKLAKYFNDRYGQTVVMGTPYNGSVLTTPTYDGSGQAVHPDVCYIPAGWNGYSHWMALTPFPSQNDDYENPSILHSNDGSTWTVPSGLTNPIVAFPGGSYFNSDPDLVYNPGDSKLYMFYRVNDALGEQVKVVSSSDGVTWGDTTTLLTGTYASIMSPAVIHDGTQWVMYTVDNDGGQLIQRRTCSTLTGTWSAPTTCTFSPTLASRAEYPWHLDAWYLNSRTYLFLTATATAGVWNAYPRQMIASSADGLAFTPTRRLIVNAVSESYWDRMPYRGSAVLADDGQSVRVWYSASQATNGSGPWRIGYTTIPIAELDG